MTAPDEPVPAPPQPSQAPDDDKRYETKLTVTSNVLLGVLAVIAGLAGVYIAGNVTSDATRTQILAQQDDRLRELKQATYSKRYAQRLARLNEGGIIITELTASQGSLSPELLARRSTYLADNSLDSQLFAELTLVSNQAAYAADLDLGKAVTALDQAISTYVVEATNSALRARQQDEINRLVRACADAASKYVEAAREDLGVTGALSVNTAD